MRFEICKNRKGDWYFRYVAANGEKIFVSEGYKNKGDMLHGIDLVKNTVPDAPVVDISVKRKAKNER